MYICRFFNRISGSLGIYSFLINKFVKEFIGMYVVRFFLNLDILFSSCSLVKLYIFFRFLIYLEDNNIFIIL